MDESPETPSEVPVSDPAIDPGMDGLPLSSSLHEAAAKIGIELTTEQSEGLEAYCKQLWDWNEKLNLTRHTNYDLFARRDLLDAWHLAQLLQPEEEILDVGTGGGVPGVPVAILRPDVHVAVCDSVAKKAKAVDAIVSHLNLPVAVHATRVQDLLEDFRYSSLVSRAVGPLDKLCNWLKDSWHGFDRMLAIKGPKWIEERGAARHKGLLHGLELRKLDSYLMPGTESQSVILQLRRVRPGQTAQDSDE